jgi:hypothetical protein
MSEGGVLFAELGVSLGALDGVVGGLDFVGVCADVLAAARAIALGVNPIGVFAVSHVKLGVGDACLIELVYLGLKLVGFGLGGGDGLDEIGGKFGEGCLGLFLAHGVGAW